MESSATLDCPLCPKRFTRQFNLKSHIRAHRDERPFACSTCGRSFTRLHDCKVHEKLHTAETKRHTCGVCHAQFARVYSLNRHYHTKTGRKCREVRKEQDGQYGASSAVNGSGMPSGERLELVGGLSQTGRPAELIIVNDRRSVSLRTGEEVSQDYEKGIERSVDKAQQSAEGTAALPLESDNPSRIPVSRRSPSPILPATLSRLLIPQWLTPRDVRGTCVLECARNGRHPRCKAHERKFDYSSSELELSLQSAPSAKEAEVSDNDRVSEDHGKDNAISAAEALETPRRLPWANAWISSDNEWQREENNGRKWEHKIEWVRSHNPATS